MLKILSRKTLDKIRKDLLFIKEQGYSAVLYGSYVRNEDTPRSDIDVAVINSKIRDKKKNMKIWWQLLGKASSIYDIRIFELLPLYIKIEIIEEHIVLFGDELELSEYFYFYRKLWKDQVHRIEENQFSSIREKIETLERFHKRRR